MCLAVPGRIERIEDGDTLMRLASVRFDGAVRQVNLAYVPEATVGDYVLVHVGFAISLIDEAAARRSLALLAEAIEKEEEQRR